MKLSRANQQRLKRLKTVTATAAITLRDAAGNAATKTYRFKLNSGR